MYLTPTKNFSLTSYILKEIIFSLTEETRHLCEQIKCMLKCARCIKMPCDFRSNKKSKIRAVSLRHLQIEGREVGRKACPKWGNGHWVLALLESVWSPESVDGFSYGLCELVSLGCGLQAECPCACSSRWGSQGWLFPFQLRALIDYAPASLVFSYLPPTQSR